MLAGALAQHHRVENYGSCRFFTSSTSTFFLPEEKSIDINALAMALIATLQDKGGSLSDEDINVSLIRFLFDSPNLKPYSNGALTPIQPYRSSILNKLAVLDKNVLIDTIFLYYSLGQYDMIKLIKSPGVIFGPSSNDKQEYYGNLFQKATQLDSNSKEQLLRLFHLILGNNNYLAEFLSRPRIFNTDKVNTVRAIEAIVDIMSFDTNSADDNDADRYVRRFLNSEAHSGNEAKNSCHIF